MAAVATQQTHKATLELLTSAAREGRPAPTYVEIGRAIDRKSVASVARVLDRLISDGHIRQHKVGMGNIFEIVATGERTAPPTRPQAQSRQTSTAAPTAADVVVPPLRHIAGMPARARDAVLAVINRDGCRWPEGDPRKTDFRMCGAPRAAGRPYCEHHYERACERTAGRSASDAA